MIRFEELFLAVFLPWNDDDGEHIEDSEPTIMEARSSFLSRTDNLCNRLSERPIVEPTQSGGSSNVNEGIGVEVEGDDDTRMPTLSSSDSLAAKHTTGLVIVWLTYILSIGALAHLII